LPPTQHPIAPAPKIAIIQRTIPAGMATAIAPGMTSRAQEQGKVGYAVAWLLGIPLPVLLLVYLFSRAC
jgi:hypothetical protein